MNSYDARRVLEESIEKLNTPKAWAIIAGSVAGLYVLHRKGIFSMNSYDARRMLEKVIDKVGDSDF